ncbi:DUF3515 domain-containing protein [Streptomyces sp. NPDC048111]|uniref:DUF3515 domain-containing protein n=1 Tax=Streptomyces sp. NPDC048111 TaxID=3365500 RepID=UPI003711A81A
MASLKWGRRQAIGIGLTAAVTAGGFFLLAPKDSLPPIAAAADASDPMCTKVISKLPQKIGDASRRDVGASGAAAWGKPSIVLRCGVTPPIPTIDACIDVNGIHWVLDEDKAKRQGVRTLTTYGRKPAVEVSFFDPSDQAGGDLVPLEAAISQIPQTSKCL